MSIKESLYHSFTKLYTPLYTGRGWGWVFLFFIPLASSAQFNTDRLLTIGRSALYYEDYVLSIQYFNQAITAKPYLYEPWFYRAIAKYYLDDFAGSERDCSEAIQRNPYVTNLYELRGLTRINQEKFSEAVDDYSRALKYAPENLGLWHNRVLCHIQNKEYEKALLELDTIQRRWSQYAKAYALRADVYMQMKDTTQAFEALNKSIEIDPYDGQTWAARSIIYLSREEWDSAVVQLDKAIHLMPRHANYHINRALARVHTNNLRGAMADYDMALDLEPNNFLGHYNRGLLRAQVGDDNRAITDFDFVLRLEPDNMLALFNRAVLLENTGDLKGAIRDYSKVIDEFPNFWLGLESRAACYRKMGMNKQAEADELTVYKARLFKHLYGTQPRMDPDKIRKRSDADVEKYNQLVMEDEQESEHEYANDYRGHVQNHRVDMEFQPMMLLSYEPQRSEVSRYTAYDTYVEKMNRQLKGRQVYITTQNSGMDDRRTASYFSLIDSLTQAIEGAKTEKKASDLLLQRAIAFTMIQNYDGAIDDLSTYLQIDSASVLALWQRAFCQMRINRFQASQGTNVQLQNASVQGDLTHALELHPHSPWLLYNRATQAALNQDYERAIADYTAALEHEPMLAEAYYNRGLCLIYMKRQEEGLQDLGKAGELGLYTAYSLIKKNKKQKTE